MVSLGKIGLRSKLLLLMTGTALMALVMACAALVYFDQLSLMKEVRSGLEREAQKLASQSRVELDFDLGEEMGGVFSIFFENPRLVGAAVYRADGSRFAVHTRGNADSILPQEASDGSWSAPIGHVAAIATVSNAEGTLIGTVLLIRDLLDVRQRAREFVGIAGVVLGVSFVAALLVSMRLQRHITVPLLELSVAANSVARRYDYGVRVQRKHDDEIGELVDDFNSMLAQLQYRDIRLKEAQDTLEQKVMERTAKLRESEERFGKAFEASPAAIALLALEDGRFLNVNESFVRLAGRDRATVLAGTDQELGIWTNPADRDRLFGEVGWKKAVRDFECILRAGNEEERVVLMSAEGVALGDRRCLLLQAHDLTERVRLERQLLQSQKMEAIGQLAAGIAHDFNNILTIIQGHASLLSFQPPRDEEEAESITEIADATRRAADLTRQLLAFSRKQVMIPRVLDLSETIGASSRLLQRLVGETVEVVTESAPVQTLIKADAGMLDQIVMNLVVNARDAMPMGGTLKLVVDREILTDTEAERLPDATPGEYVVLSVSDSGVGMDEVTRSRIFEPFFTTKAVGKGTGLGLATVYGIVRQHDGWITVESEAGQGTTFRIYFPETTAVGERTDAPLAGGAMPRGNETVLVVEDEEALRKMVGRSLQKLGYRVIEAEDGAAALKLWSEHSRKIDAIITDVVMPGGINGRDLAVRLEQDRPDLPVIFTSGYSQDLFLSGEDELNEICFVPKPYTMETLAPVLRCRLDDEQRRGGR